MLSFYSVCCCESFDILLVNMVGSRPRNKYRKTKKGKGFSGVPKWSKRREEILPNEDENAVVRNSTPTLSTSSRGSSHLHSEDKPTSSSASRKKQSDHGFKDDSSESYNDETGFNRAWLPTFGYK